MAQRGSSFEGNYASPQSSRSDSFSELGLTLLPSYQSSCQSKSHDHGGLEPDQIGNDQPFVGTLGGFCYPSPSPTPGAWQPDRSHGPPNEQVNASNSSLAQQTSPTATAGLPATPLFLHLRRIDQSGRVCQNAVTPAYISPPQYRPSAPHLHTFISTGTTLAATAQLDQLKERNKRLTMERDRFYHLCKPATRRADDRKLQEIRELKAELRAARELNHKLQWALETQTARAQGALASAANQNAQCEALMAAYNIPITGTPLITASESTKILRYSGAESIAERPSSAYINLTSSKKLNAIQEGRLQTSKSQCAITPPTMTTGRRPPAPANDPPSKRLRTDSNTEKLSRKQHSLLNGSQINDIQARLRSELKGKSSSYAWTVEDRSNEVENVDKEVVTARADRVCEQAEDELSESEIAAFDRALEEGWDEAGEGDSLFGDG